MLPLQKASTKLIASFQIEGLLGPQSHLRLLIELQAIIYKARKDKAHKTRSKESPRLRWTWQPRLQIQRTLYLSRLRPSQRSTTLRLYMQAVLRILNLRLSSGPRASSNTYIDRISRVTFSSIALSCLEFYHLIISLPGKDSPTLSSTSKTRASFQSKRVNSVCSSTMIVSHSSSRISAWLASSISLSIIREWSQARIF